MFERRSAVGSPIVSTYAAVHGTAPELTSGAPAPYSNCVTWLSLPPPFSLRYSCACSSTASASSPFAPRLSIATIEPMISRWLSSSVAMSYSMSLRPASSSAIACVK